MSDLVITITDAGRAEVINAVNTGTAPVLIKSIVVGSGKYTPSPTQTALKTPIKPLTTFGGGAVSPDIIHVSIQDKSKDAYQMNEFGLFTDKGTLFAVYSQVDGVILEKTAQSILLLSTDIALKTLDATDIAFGDTEFVNPPATETVMGVVELATDEETQEGNDKERAVTPSSLKSLTASEERAGLIKIASQAEVTTGTSTTLAVTPKTLKTAGDGRYLQQSEYLSEIEESGAAAQSSARGSLGLGNAATKNVGVAGGNVMQVGAFGLGGGSNHKANAYNNVGEIYRVNNSSASSPTTGVAGVVSLPCDGGPSTGYIAVSYAGAAWVGSSNIPANGVKWNRVYTTEYKPSAADVDAVAKTGDRMSGALGSTAFDTYRIVAGQYGTFWRNDGNNLYLMLTNANDQWGTFNDLRPLTVNTSSGSVTLGTQLSFDNPNFIKKTGISSYQSSGVNHNQTNGFILQGTGDQSAESHFLETVGVRTALRWRIRGGGLDAWPEFRNDGSLYLAGNWPVIQTSSGATFHPDANIEGTLWGGYLSNWLNRELTARDNNINTRATWDHVNQNFIQNVRYTAETQHGATGIYTYHENTVLTGFNNWDGDYSAEELFWSYIQILKNGQWLTIGR